eukprot:16437962-Heterocapsa_arctica.AAC.1
MRMLPMSSDPIVLRLPACRTMSPGPATASSMSIAELHGTSDGMTTGPELLAAPDDEDAAIEEA